MEMEVTHLLSHHHIPAMLSRLKDGMLFFSVTFGAMASVGLVGLGVSSMVFDGDRALKWREPDAPSVIGPVMVGAKRYLPFVGPSLFKEWLQFRCMAGRDLRGLAEAARASTLEDKAPYKFIIDYCCLYMIDTGAASMSLFRAKEMQCRQVLVTLLTNAGPWMQKWVLDVWAKKYFRNISIMDSLLKDVHASGDIACLSRLAEGAAERVHRTNKTWEMGRLGKVLMQIPDLPQTPCVFDCCQAAPTFDSEESYTA